MMLRPPSWSATPASALFSANVPSPLLRKTCSGSHTSMLEVTTSSDPFPLKSSTTAPPASENAFRPAAGAASRNRPIWPDEANADGAIRYFGGTPSGYRPSVMYVRLSSHFTSRSSGLSARYDERNVSACSPSVVFAYGLLARGGNRHRSP